MLPALEARSVIGECPGVSVGVGVCLPDVEAELEADADVTPVVFFLGGFIFGDERESYIELASSLDLIGRDLSGTLSPMDLDKRREGEDTPVLALSREA